jgi:hypothetical protein
MWLFVTIPVVIAGLGLIIWIAGSLLPKAHSITRSARLPVAPEAAWAVIADFANEAKWNRAIKESRRIEDRNGHEVWLTLDRRGGKMPLETLESDPPKKLVRKIADPKLPFGGKWTITVEPEGTGSAVTVTEDSEVYNPFFRFIARTFMDDAGTVNSYLSGLSAHLTGPQARTKE